MIDLHPPISGLPLASLLLLLFAEAGALFRRTQSWRDVARVIGVGGCALSVVLAFISGYQASSMANGLAQVTEEALAWHHSLGRLLLINSLFLATFFTLARVAKHGRPGFIALYYLSLIAQVIGTIWVGYLGGSLVFKHGVNVSQLVQ